MADPIDVIYRLRDMASNAAEDLRAAIAEAQTVIDKLDAFADQSEEAAEWAVAGPGARERGHHGGAQGKPNPAAAEATR